MPMKIRKEIERPIYLKRKAQPAKRFCFYYSNNDKFMEALNELMDSFKKALPQTKMKNLFSLSTPTLIKSINIILKGVFNKVFLWCMKS